MRRYRTERKRPARLVAGELLAGSRFRVEEPAPFDGLVIDDLQRRFGGRRWRSEKLVLQPGEPLMLDPGQYPEGTELGIMRPRRLQAPLQWWLTYREVAHYLIVSVKRLRNLMGQHKLERRIQWVGGGRGGKRRRIALPPPATVHRLAELTGRPFLKQ